MVYNENSKYYKDDKVTWYFLFKNYEKDVLKDIIKVLEHVEKNNIKLGGELLKNLELNLLKNKNH